MNKWQKFAWGFSIGFLIAGTFFIITGIFPQLLIKNPNPILSGIILGEGVIIFVLGIYFFLMRKYV